MTEICLFGGTTEGHRMAEFLSRQNTDLMVCTATEYGSELLDGLHNIQRSDKRMSEEDMIALLTEKHFDLVIDATHPYAFQVTQNISSVCRKTGTPYLRILRDTFESKDNIITVPDTAAAVSFLENTEGYILLTTGSKEIGTFSVLSNFSDRVYARVLPVPDSIEACIKAGLKPSHILAMQGPFSEEMNTAMLKSVHAAWMVTKDSGTAGGYAEKVKAAEKNCVRMIVIGRPAREDGVTEAAAYEILQEKFGFSRKPTVKIIGIGPGDVRHMTEAVRQAILEADCLIGAKRMLDAAHSPGKPAHEAVSAENIAAFIKEHPEFQNFAVLMSGDSGFFSGAKNLIPLLENCNTVVLPGISSLSYFCSKLGISYENVVMVSLHGRSHNIVRDVRSYPRVFALTGGSNTPSAICQLLCGAGLGNVRVYIGEQLSYPDERIQIGSVSEFADHEFAPLSVMLIENNAPDRIVTQGLPDELFNRDTGEKGLIPMTKSEIRAVCLSKLQLIGDAVCWDIGAGSGSIAIEMALAARSGQVYAIDQDACAVELIRKNALQMGADNLTVIHGSAPEVCEGLPTPTHVFIGGSSGNMKEIFTMLLKRNKAMKIAAAAVSLDTIAELTEITSTLRFSSSDVVMVQTAKGKKAGCHQLMLGGNPVYIFSMTTDGEVR